MPQAELRQNVMEQIVELYDEVEGVREPISAQARRTTVERRFMPLDAGAAARA
jgi:hypothetical protein